jgi:NitT/TauT family transport system substrate-binding protein
MNKIKTVLAILVILIVVIAGTLTFYVYNSRPQPVKIVGSITFSYAKTEAAAGVYVADELGMFGKNGLNVTFLPVDSGLVAYNSMIGGKANLSSPAEYVVVGGMFRHENVKIISTIVKVRMFSLIGRKDHGIQTEKDLFGKKIGLLKGSIEEFYLGRFLELNGMNIANVTLVNMNFSETPGNIKDGLVDAVIALPPYDNMIKTALGTEMVDWSVHSGHALYAVIACTDGWLAQNHDLIVRFLRALNQANNYIAQHSKEAKSIVQRRLSSSNESIETILERNYFALSLDQSLVLSMEDEGRWMIRNNLTKEKSLPNILNSIDESCLEKVSPESINIIR